MRTISSIDRRRWNADAAPLPRPNHAFDAVAFRGELWVLGGRRAEDVLREVWIYSPEQDAWRRGQKVAVHGWIYSLSDGLLRDLGLVIESPDQVPPEYRYY